MSEFMTLLVKLAWMVFCLGLGLLLLFLYSSFMRTYEHQDEAKRMEELHENLSAAENYERLNLLHKVEMASNPAERRHYHEKYRELQRIHKTEWTKRVQQIVNLQAPLSDAELKEHGLYPYDN